MKKYTNQKKQAIAELLALKIKTANELMKAKRKIAKKYKLGIFSNPEILVETRHGASLRRILRKRAVRTMSGIAPVAVLTKPYPCPGKCAYCPTEKNVPQSYLSNEPAVMRAIRCNYNPYAQVQDRLRALVANGHEPTKIELIVIGGTWSYLPKKYKYWYILNLFVGANRFKFFNNQYSSVKQAQATPKQYSIFNNQYPITLSIKKLKKLLIIEQKKNEKAKYKIIGLTLETRPDYIDEKELWEMRELGCTRVEIGVQCLDDEILKLNKRGHGVKEIVEATSLLRRFGFKVTYHLMPGLPGATPAKDLKMFKTLFSDERFQPDQIKFYPTVVTRGSLLYHWWKQGKYKPYSDKVLKNLIIKCKKIVPEYVRVIRLIRDIPGESIIAGNLITNLRQIIKDEGVECRCIRCREARERASITNCQLRIINYPASGGQEYFIAFESKDRKTLYGFCRLRLPNIVIANGKIAKQSNPAPFSVQSGNSIIRQFNNSAIIRELHVYGELVSVGKNKKIQHAGLGKKLLAEAEKIALANKYKKIVVISGVGVRGYYRKFGYRLSGTYMVKLIENFNGYNKTA